MRSLRTPDSKGRRQCHEIWISSSLISLSFTSYIHELKATSPLVGQGISCEVLRQVYANFGIETFQEEQQKAIDIKFFESNDVFFLLLYYIKQRQWLIASPF